MRKKLKAERLVMETNVEGSRGKCDRDVVKNDRKIDGVYVEV